MPDGERTDPVVDSELMRSVSALPRIPNLRAEDPDRFAQAVRRLLERRAQRGWPGEVAEHEVGAFVLVPRPRQLRGHLGSTPIIDPDATTEPVLGRVLLLTRDAGAGEVLRMPCHPNELDDWLEREGLGCAPLVRAYRRTSTMTFRRRGAASHRSRSDTIRERPPAANRTELREALEHFHKASLRSPRYCVRGVWQRKLSEYYVPGERPEKAIQEGLTVALNSWFHGVVKAETEDSTEVGRIDVRLLAATASGPLEYWAIVELKVVKSFTNAGSKDEATGVDRSENIRAITEGLRQAWAYQVNRQTVLGLLEVYDLRKEKHDDLFADQKVDECLANLSPVPDYACRPLYGSAAHLRKAEATSA